MPNPRSLRRWIVILGLAGLAGTALAQGTPQPGAPPAPASPPQATPPPAPPAPGAQAQVDPQTQQVLDALKALNPQPIHTLKPAQARQQPGLKDAVSSLLQKQGKPTEPEKVAKVEDRTIPGPQGNLPVRVYTPEGSGPFPVLVYFHGGGFVLGNLDTFDASARALANQGKAVVVSVQYRQAPEHQFPAALDDAAAAFRYIQKNAAQFNGDPKRVAVGGESAGANLATAVALRQKKNGSVLPVYQLLIYPFVSNDLSTPSNQQFGGGQYLLSNDDLGWFWQQYLGNNWRDNRNPEAVPLQARPEQLRGLPPAFVITAGLDPLHDAGQQYASKLQDAGVPVDVRNYDGVIHDFFGLAPVLDKAKQAQTDAGQALQRAFSQPKQGQGIGGSGSQPVPPGPP
ncbi:alpha/beta hydrolase [Vitiosangium sp. GDMCC 1.1324]|uniref:alpha/beta hydrolase n=1 Tax=Vitiosangium sp. (strain GDMCC 1.1324) TaxID=2138576 RepID=UPI000D3A3123|nr:alpha/beta hydrolase [Vitiosangium sp. GDMCC 1.1324]PTL78504.1 alpha/beta hydrolase [Vitiosangium sp. GDMCC 1.1324]